jgi:hypothetical protein
MPPLSRCKSAPTTGTLEAPIGERGYPWESTQLLIALDCAKDFKEQPLSSTAMNTPLIDLGRGHLACLNRRFDQGLATQLAQPTFLA